MNLDALFVPSELSTVRERLFDHAYMASIWDTACEANGIEGKPSIIGTLLSDIEKWFETSGFENVRLYYSFELYMWATGRFEPNMWLGDGVYGSGSHRCGVPLIYTNVGIVMETLRYRLTSDGNYTIGLRVTVKGTDDRFCIKVHGLPTEPGSRIKVPMTNLGLELFYDSFDFDPVLYENAKNTYNKLNNNTFIWQDYMSAKDLSWYRKNLYHRDLTFAFPNIGIATLANQIADNSESQISQTIHILSSQIQELEQIKQTTRGQLLSLKNEINAITNDMGVLTKELKIVDKKCADRSAEIVNKWTGRLEKETTELAETRTNYEWSRALGILIFSFLLGFYINSL